MPALYAIAVVPTFMFGYITFYACTSLLSAMLMLAFFVPGCSTPAIGSTTAARWYE